MSSGVLNRTHPNDSAVSAVRSSFLAGEGGVAWKPKEVKRSASTDEVYAVNRATYVNGGLEGRSTSNGGHREAGKNSPFRETVPFGTLPANIVYGPQDLVTGPQDWSPLKEMNGGFELCEPDATLGPAKDYIRRYMKRSISIYDDYGSAGNWFFPAQYNRPLCNSSTFQESSRQLFKREAVSPVLTSKANSTKDARAVSQRETMVKRSPSTDDAKQTDELKNDTWAAPYLVSAVVQKCLTKGSPSVDEDALIARSNNKETRTAERSASSDNAFAAEKVKKSLSTDSIEEPTWAHLKALSPIEKIDYKGENHSTGLVKRSRSLDDSRIFSLMTPSFQKDSRSPLKIKRSLSFDGRKSSTDSSEEGIPFQAPKSVVQLTDSEAPMKAAEVLDAGKVKRSLSTDEAVNVKRVTWAVPTESPSIKRSAVRVKRSMSIDWAAGGGMTWIPKSILKESAIRGEHFDVKTVKRSSSIDTRRSISASKSPHALAKALQSEMNGILCSSKEDRPLSRSQKGDTSKRLTRSTSKGRVTSLKNSKNSKNKVIVGMTGVSSVKVLRSKNMSNPSNQVVAVVLKQTKELVDGATKFGQVQQIKFTRSRKQRTDTTSAIDKERSSTVDLQDSRSVFENGGGTGLREDVMAKKNTLRGKTVRDDSGIKQIKTTPRGGASKSVEGKIPVAIDAQQNEKATGSKAIRVNGVRRSDKVECSTSNDKIFWDVKMETSASVDVVEKKSLRGKVMKDGNTTNSSEVKSSSLYDESATSLKLQSTNAIEKNSKSKGKTRNGRRASSVNLKRTASTDVMEKKMSLEDQCGKGSKLQRVASRQSSKEDVSLVFDASKLETSQNKLATDLKRTVSTDGIKEPDSAVTETGNVLTSTDLKRTVSTDAMKEKKPSWGAEKETQSSLTELESSSSKKNRRTSVKAQKSTAAENDSSSCTSNTSESKENVRIIKPRNKRAASKEDAGRPSKIERSPSKDDASSSKDSKRDSGISISEDPSGSEFESDCKPKKRFKKKGKGENYDCAICSKSFRGITDLRRHLLIHADEKPHVCELCNKAYRQNVNLKNHMKVEHSKQMDFVCRFCMKPFPLKQRLKLHLRTHVGEKPFSCPHCPKTFGRGAQLQQHMKSHDSSMKPPMPPSTLLNETPEKPSLDGSGTKDCICKLCNLSYETERGMRHHMSLAHGTVTDFECQICEKQIQEDLATHMKTHAISRPHECEVCKAVFAQRTQYNVHMRTHTGERPYQCRVCWQSFGHTNVLKLHIRKHTGEKPFKCVICKQVQIAFSQLSHLKTHMKTIHKEEGAYICEGCRTCFKIKFHLENHVKTCEKIPESSRHLSIEEQRAADKEADTLAQLRYLMAVLLKKISTPEKLALLGFEKRLIDNVLIAALQLADQKAYDDKTMNELDQMKLNIEAFLEWIVPTEVMDLFKVECPSIESILDKIVSMYLKKGE